MAPAQLTVAELATTEGLDLGTSDWLAVEQPRVDGFADVTEDHQWVHVDPVRAAAGPFGATIVHGYLILSLVPYLLAQVVTISDEEQLVNYGLERVRFTSPLLVGSHIRLTATLNRSELRPDGSVKYSVGVAVQARDAERPAMVGEAVYLSYPARERT